MHNIEFPNGEVIELDYDDVKHRYMVGDDVVPSVTRVVDGAFPKQGLIDWAVKSGADFFKASVAQYQLGPELDKDGVNRGMYMFPSSLVNHVYEGIVGAHKAISNEALDTGSLVHKWIEEAIKWKMGKGEAPEVPDDEAAVNCIEAFREWIKDLDVKWLAIEEKIYSKKYKYAGTVDAVAEINDELTVIDFKTSAKIYKPYHLQVAAYSQAISEMYGKPVDRGLILRLDKDTGKFQTKTFDPNPHLEIFLLCMKLRQWSSDRIKNLK
jgi:hypothetical protein